MRRRTQIGLRRMHLGEKFVVGNTCGGDPEMWFLDEYLLDEVLRHRGDVGGEGKHARQDVPLESRDGVGSERHLCGEDEKEEHTQRPHVHAGASVG